MSFTTIKVLMLKRYFDVVLAGDEKINIGERLYYIWKSLLTFTPIALLLKALDLWFEVHGLFFTVVVLFILGNMFFGMYMHKKKNTFSWEILLSRTTKMAVVVIGTYVVLELILMIAGTNIVTETFRTALQVATLLYPGSKILKNIFIISNGEHPPKWIMNKIYNFQENGDLSELLDTKNKEEN